MGLYQPEYRDAKGVIRKSPTWWARYGARGELHRESTQTTDYQEAKRFLKERELAVAREEPIKNKINRVTFREMADALRRDYDLNGRHLATLTSRLMHLEAFFGPQHMASRPCSPVVEEVGDHHAAPDNRGADTDGLGGGGSGARAARPSTRTRWPCPSVERGSAEGLLRRIAAVGTFL